MKFKNWLFLFLFLWFSSAIFSQEKIVFDVKIKGAKKTKISFLKKILSVKQNDVLDSISLEKDIIQLKRLPAISHAYYQVFYSHKNLYNVFITVEENFTLIPEVNFWTTTNQQFSYKLACMIIIFLEETSHLVVFIKIMVLILMV